MLFVYTGVTVNGYKFSFLIKHRMCVSRRLAVNLYHNMPYRYLLKLFKMNTPRLKNVLYSSY